MSSGAIAGAIAKTFIAPLDRTKINFQIKWGSCIIRRPSHDANHFVFICFSKHIKYSFRNALGFLKRTYRKEGFLALYRGNTATLARIIPYSACQFASFEQYKRLLKVDEAKDPHFRRFLAGSLAGITSQGVTYPLDLARARMAITDKCGYKWVTNHLLSILTYRYLSDFRNIWDVFVAIYTKENGTRALYRGFVPTVLGVIPYAGTSFFTYETLKQKYFEMTGETKPNAIYSLLFGACAGICGQTSSYPMGEFNDNNW